MKNLIKICLALSLLFSVWPIKLLAEAADNALSRAYSKKEHFVVRAAEQRVSIPPVTLWQFPYAGVLVRPDDTVAEKLARILALSTPITTPNNVQLFIFDQAHHESAATAATNGEPLETSQAICVYIPIEASEKANRWVAALRTQIPHCAAAGVTHIILNNSALLNSPRTRFSDGSLTEIGHRIAAEEIFKELLKLPTKTLTLTPPPLFKYRINIYPDRNERLASID